MDERLINEAAGHVTSAAAQLERVATEILGAVREGRFDPAPVGSPAYVRALRDRYVGELLAGFYARPDSDYEDDGFVTEVVIRQANDTIRALGYEVPGEEE